MTQLEDRVAVHWKSMVISFEGNGVRDVWTVQMILKYIMCFLPWMLNGYIILIDQVPVNGHIELVDHVAIRVLVEHIDALYKCIISNAGMAGKALWDAEHMVTKFRIQMTQILKYRFDCQRRRLELDHVGRLVARYTFPWASVAVDAFMIVAMYF